MNEPSEQKRFDCIRRLRTPLLICGSLALLVWAVFGQTIHDDFINYDDDIYIYNNPVIFRGLDIDKIAWAFTHNTGLDEWYPVTSISHMADWQLYGPNAGGHHLTNVLLHCTAAIFLFLTLQKMTAAMWRSAFVAAVFAIHPLRVESVAWVTERKDVLSGLFFMLALWTWAGYMEKRRNIPPPETEETQIFPVANLSFWTRDYCLALVFFALGLLSKSMIVTLPFILLLLDYWPFYRFSSHPHSRRSAILEKVPFFIVSAGGCVATILSEPDVVASVHGLSPIWRLGNALMAYIDYIGHMIYPVGLALLYSPPEGQLPFWRVVFSAAAILLVSIGVIIGRRKYPYLLAGWFWYLVTLLPVIDMMQAGDQARADRYTYLPQIGLYVMIAWGTAQLCRSWRQPAFVLAPVSILILIALSVDAHVQTAYWKNSVTLWTRTLACTPNSYIAHCNLGIALADAGQLKPAVRHFNEALKLNPNDARALNNLGKVLTIQGKWNEAIQDFDKSLKFNTNDVEVLNNLGVALGDEGKMDEASDVLERAIQLDADYADAFYDLGNVLAARGFLDEAIDNYSHALQINPGLAEAHCNLGLALARKGKLDEAIQHYEEALKIKPEYVNALNNLGGALTAEGKTDDATQNYEKALQLDPDNPDTLNNLGVALARQGKLDDAIHDFKQVLQFKPDDPSAYNNLGIAMAAQGKTERAVQYFQQALYLARAQNKTALEDSIRNRLNSFRSAPLQ